MNHVRLLLILAAFIVAGGSASGQPLDTSLVGEWDVVGGSSPGGGSYNGTLTIDTSGRIYTLFWRVGLSRYSGMGFYQNGHLLVGWGFQNDYGVILYDLLSDGSIYGRWAFFGDGRIGSERAVRSAFSPPDSLGTLYNVFGVNPDASQYWGSFSVFGIGDVLRLRWSVRGQSLRGVGLRVGDQIVAGWGGGPYNNFGVMEYEISGDKGIGRWTVPDTDMLGRETIIRRR